MSLFDRFKQHLSDEEQYASELDPEFGPGDFERENYVTAETVHAVPAIKLVERALAVCDRLVETTDERVRAAEKEAFRAEGELATLKRDYELMRYERNEAMQRIAKMYAVLNKKQQKLLEKAPFEFKNGPPLLQMHVFDPSILDYRRIDVPAPARMETVRRKGSHGGAPMTAVSVSHADQKTQQSNRDIEREQATLRQSRRGK